jgi:hypothetical protein
MIVLFKLETGYCGEDSNEVYEFPDETTEEALDEYGRDLAFDNFEMFGHSVEEEEEESGIEYEPIFSWEVLDGYREDIESEYGHIQEA